MKGVIDMAFSKNQIEFMKKIGISVDFSKKLSDSNYEAIEEKVSEYLQKSGFDKDYLPTEEGKICEAILDVL
jgi:hypothetical protein